MLFFYIVYFISVFLCLGIETYLIDDLQNILINERNKGEKKEKKCKKKRFELNIILISSLLINIALDYFLLVPMGKFLITIIFDGEILITAILLILTNIKKVNKKILILLHGGFAAFIIILIISSATMFRAKEYRDMIPKVTSKTFSKEITPFDTTKAPIITKQTAEQIADKKIGSLSNMGSKSQVGQLTLQNVNGNLLWVAPLEYNSFFAWVNNKNEGTSYITVNANNKKCNLVQSHIKYQPEACFGQDLKRILYQNNSGNGYTDFTFEIDDKGIPYWTASIYTNKIGISGTHITGIALANGETGKIKEYSIKDAPKWIDRIQPVYVVNNNLNSKGKFIHGFKFFNDNDKTKTSQGMGIVFNKGKCYYYTGATSIGGDESSLGFYLVDTRTMDTTFYKMGGATEEAAVHSAEGKVQNLNYSGSFPILLNVENTPTYLVALNDKNKLTKLYAMVNVKDYSIIATGQNIKSCQSNYIRILSTKNQVKETKGKDKTITDTVNRINSYIEENNTYYSILLNHHKGLFNVPYNQNSYLPVTKKGDEVKIKYVDTKNMKIINTLDFQNLSLQK